MLGSFLIHFLVWYIKCSSVFNHAYSCISYSDILIHAMIFYVLVISLWYWIRLYIDWKSYQIKD